MEKQQIDPRDGESEVAIIGDKPIQSETTTHASNSNLPSSSASTSDQISNDESKPEPTIKQGLINIVKSSWINPLVVFIPFGIASHFVWSSTVTFILNFIAIVPLAKLLGFATEDIALRTGEVNISPNETSPINHVISATAHIFLYRSLVDCLTLLSVMP